MRQLQTTKRHYKMYKQGRFWVIAGITVATLELTQVVGQADRVESGDATTATTTLNQHPVGQENAVTLKTTAATSPSKVQPTSDGSQLPTNDQATSEAPVSQKNAETGAQAETVRQSAASPSSEGTQAAKTAQPAGQSAAPAGIGQTSAPAKTTSAASQVAQPSGTVKTTPAPSTPKPKKMVRASLAARVADPEDQDLSGQFTDANLLAAVRKGLKLKDGVTLTKRVIQNFGHTNFMDVAVKDASGDYQPINNFKGLEVLRDLAPEIRVTVDAQLQDSATDPSLKNFDFTPLKAINLGQLNLYTYYWSTVPDEQLKILASLDPKNIQNLNFSTPSTATINPYGMTNHQFALLVPLVKGVLENQYPSSQMVGFAGNNITDFSALKELSANKSSQVTGWLQYAWNTNTITYSPGETVVVDSPITGVQGESFNFKVYYYKDDGAGNAVWTLADANQVTKTNVDGTTVKVWQYTLVDPLVYKGNIVYGAPSYAQAVNYRYLTDINGQPMADFSLMAGDLIFQPVTSSKAQLTFNASEVVMGPKATWNYLDHIAHVTDYEGNVIDSKDWSNLIIKNVNGCPDLSTAGLQTVEFAYTDNQGVVHTATASVNVVASQAAITANDDLVVWPKDAAQLTVNELVKNVTDAYVQTVTDFSNVTMTTIHTDQAGAQTVTLTYTDVSGNRVSTTVKVTVDLASLTTNDTQLIAGPNAKWDYATNVQTVTDSSGQPIDVKNGDVKVVTGPDLSVGMVGKPQTIVLAYTDNLGRTQEFTAIVTTVKSQAAVGGRDVTIVAGPNASWTLNDSVDWQKTFGADGQLLSVANLNQITADGVPTVNQPGTTVLTLSYVDEAGNLVTGTATVKVVASQATLQVKDSQLTVGASWRVTDNLVSATDMNGQPLDVNALTVTGTVDTSKAGRYSVTYAYTDAAGNRYMQTAVITVVDPTDPVDPVDPTDPTDPVDPTDPTDPTDPVDPVDPTDPTDPTDPADSIDPTHPTAPDQGQAITTAPGAGDELKTAPTQKVVTPSSQPQHLAVMTPVKQVVAPTTTPKAAKATALPQTDEHDTGLAGLLVGLLGLLGLAGIGTKRRHEH